MSKSEGVKAEVFLTACADWSDASGVPLFYTRGETGEWQATITISDTYGSTSKTLRPLARERVEYPGRGKARRRAETVDEYSARIHRRLTQMVVGLRAERNQTNLNRLRDVPAISQRVEPGLHNLFPAPVGFGQRAQRLIDQIETHPADAVSASAA